MTLLHGSHPTTIESVLHPTDLSEASERAFHHALALAIRSSAQFTLLHAVGRRASDNWAEFPSVRAKLSEWRAAGTTASLEEQIKASNVAKVEVSIPDPVAASLEHIRGHAVDLIVMATEGRSGLKRLVRPSRAEELARQSKIDTLFVPVEARPFVDASTGAVSLRRILIPVGPNADPTPAMRRAVQSAALVEEPEAEITLLHVADGEGVSVKSLPQLPFCKWDAVRRQGDVVEEILALTEELQADAIYMSSHWHGGGRSVLGGHDVTEGVLHSASCPVLVTSVD